MHAIGERMTNGPVDASQEHPSCRRDSQIPTAPPSLAALREMEERRKNAQDECETINHDEVSSGAGAVHPARFGARVDLLRTRFCCLSVGGLHLFPPHYLLHDSGRLYLQKRRSCCIYTIALDRSSVVRTTEVGGDRGLG